MSTAIPLKLTSARATSSAWLPVAFLPLAAAVLTAAQPAWLQMGALALSIYAACKWLTFAVSPLARRAAPLKAMGYLLLWTGMDAAAFFRPIQGVATRRTQWIWAGAQTALGVWLLLVAAPALVASQPLVAGWIAMTGMVSVLHFGVSQLASLAWRTAGVNAQHIMHKPVLATSLADFWGRRWNLAFRDLMHQFVLRPLVPRVGSSRALLAVFLVSGLIHDLVISYAARGGWGLPTVYFLVQGSAVLFERSSRAARWGLGKGVRGWLFAAAVVVLPAGLLFHPPFVLRVVVPLIEALSAGRS